jgi:uridine monophosphate synthetase
MKRPTTPPSSSQETINSELSFIKRASLTRHKTAQRLFQIMEAKQSNLALALDVSSQAQLLEMADELGPKLCMLKTHVDILEDFTPNFGEKLKILSNKHNFLIFEDRKFADIGQVVQLQFSKGVYRISDWADIINAHIIAGPGTIDGLNKIALPKEIGLLLIAEMSSHGMMAFGEYTQKTISLAQEHANSVMGFICQRRLSTLPGMIHCTPGVHLKGGSDALGQRYNTVEDILTKNKSDLIIVGRDIFQHADPKAQAEHYRKAAWDAYLARFS